MVSKRLRMVSKDVSFEVTPEDIRLLTVHHVQLRRRAYG